MCRASVFEHNAGSKTQERHSLLDSTRNIYPVHMCTTFIIIGGSIISLSRPYPARDTRYRWVYKRCSIVVSVSE